MAEPTSTASTTKLQAKRVFLRLQVEDFSGCEKHFAHIEPFQDPEIQQTRFHITLDMEQALAENPDFGKLPHEIYHVRRE
jgi:hypothetical protein